MNRWIVAVLLLLLPPVARAADPTPSVLVQTQAAHKGALPDLLTAYGSAQPSLNGAMTLSLQQDGRVTAIAVTPGEAVRKDERLLEFTASAAASSAWKQAVSALALARTQRAHTAQLLAQRLATRDQLAQVDKAVTDAQASLDALKREGAGQAAQTLTAPFDGIVTAILVAQGERVAPNAPLVTLTRLDGLVVTVGVEPGDRVRVHPGQPVSLTPLSGGSAVQGDVVRVDGMLNPKTRMIDTDIRVPAGAVIAGETFRATVTIGQLNGWLVPHEAVLTDETGAYLFQAVGNKAHRVAVKVLGTLRDTEVVTGQLRPESPVVVQGNYQLAEGAMIRETPPREAER